MEGCASGSNVISNARSSCGWKAEKTVTMLPAAWWAPARLTSAALHERDLAEGFGRSSRQLAENSSGARAWAGSGVPSSCARWTAYRRHPPPPSAGSVQKAVRNAAAGEFIKPITPMLRHLHHLLAAGHDIRTAGAAGS